MREAADGDEDSAMMREAMAAAAAVRTGTSPNPWVGCVIVPADEAPAAIGATEPPGGRHAEVVALELAGPSARGAVVYVTLEPCCHHGRTPPCVDGLIAAGVRRVVVGALDPDRRVSGAGIERLQAAGIEVTVGVCGDEVTDQLAPYLKHRTTGRPWVVLKLASTLDGRSAAPDGSSQWITGPLARADGHRLRGESDAILVGAGTVRADDPALTVRFGEDPVPPVRLGDGPPSRRGDGPVPPVGLGDGPPPRRGEDPVPPSRRGDEPAPAARLGDGQPLRVVLGHAPAGARVHPALELSGDLGAVLDDLGARGVLQLLVEGGATVAHDFHRAGLVDRYVLYLAPAFFGGNDGRALFAGPGSATIDDLWRGRIVSVEQLGPDLRLEVAAGPTTHAQQAA